MVWFIRLRRCISEIDLLNRYDEDILDILLDKYWSFLKMNNDMCMFYIFCASCKLRIGLISLTLICCMYTTLKFSQSIYTVCNCMLSYYVWGNKSSLNQSNYKPDKNTWCTIGGIYIYTTQNTTNIQQCGHHKIW